MGVGGLTTYHTHDGKARASSLVLYIVKWCKKLVFVMFKVSVMFKESCKDSYGH